MFVFLWAAIDQEMSEVRRCMMLNVCVEIIAMHSMLCVPDRLDKASGEEICEGESSVDIDIQG